MPSEVSEENALAEGAEILSHRKERLRIEAGLTKRMGHSMIKEWMFWAGVALCLLFSSSPPLGVRYWFLPVFLILAGMECAAMKRERALLDWIEYQRTKKQTSLLGSDE
ncbi:MAG: hypothetical protein R3F13_11600 [Prosthecobacter sp.]